ncbi:MAG: dephospho-CoA kinase [Prevotella sp.]|nr:dephospho-CoA kinase [Prevotella sp.]
MKVGITGGIGSGKSYVCKLLKERGINVYDCDAAAKRLMRTSEKLKTELESLIGKEAYTDDGNLNKAVIAQFLLRSEENAKAIDNIVHPAVAEDFLLSGYDWMECAILFESGFNQLVDKTIVVTAPTDVRIERVMNRDNICEAKAREWIGRQWQQSEIVKRADFEITNDGVQSLDEQIDTLLNTHYYIYRQCNRQF